MNKTACLLVMLLFAAASAPAQKRLSLSVYAGSGTSWYGGKSVAKTATYYPTPDIRTIPARVDQPYGNKALTNWVAGVQTYSLLSADMDLYLAVNAQIEYTGGRGTITREISQSGTRDVKGKYRISNDYISVNPQVAKVFELGSRLMLLRAGVDYAIHVEGQEEYEVPDQNGNPFITGYSGGTGKNDLRLTAAIAIPVSHKLTIDIAYKHGLIKYPNYDARLRLLHCMLSYTIMQPKRKFGLPRF